MNLEDRETRTVEDLLKQVEIVLHATGTDMEH